MRRVFFKNRCRYLDPDPLLLSRHDRERHPTNPRFHALNQAIVQLVGSPTAAIQVS